MADAFAEVFVAVAAADGFVDYPFVVLFAAALFVDHLVVRLAGYDFEADDSGFAVLFLLPCAFAYFFLKNVSLSVQLHQQIRVLFLLACRW